MHKLFFYSAVMSVLLLYSSPLGLGIFPLTRGGKTTNELSKISSQDVIALWQYLVCIKGWDSHLLIFIVFTGRINELSFLLDAHNSIREQGCRPYTVGGRTANCFPIWPLGQFWMNFRRRKLVNNKTKKQAKFICIAEFRLQFFSLKVSEWYLRYFDLNFNASMKKKKFYVSQRI